MAWQKIEAKTIAKQLNSRGYQSYRKQTKKTKMRQGLIIRKINTYIVGILVDMMPQVQTYQEWSKGVENTLTELGYTVERNNPDKTVLTVAISN